MGHNFRSHLPFSLPPPTEEGSERAAWWVPGVQAGSAHHSPVWCPAWGMRQWQFCAKCALAVVVTKQQLLSGQSWLAALLCSLLCWALGTCWYKPWLCALPWHCWPCSAGGAALWRGSHFPLPPGVGGFIVPARPYVSCLILLINTVGISRGLCNLVSSWCKRRQFLGESILKCALRRLVRGWQHAWKDLGKCLGWLSPPMAWDYT